MAVVISWLGAAVAAGAYGSASVIQATAAGRARQSQHLDAMLLVRLLGQLRYVAGLGLDLVGFLATVVALRTLPLFVVQPAIASSVGVTAFVASRLLGTRLGRRDIGALVGLVVGMALLAISARPKPAVTPSNVRQWILVAGVGVALGLGVAGARLRTSVSAVVLALAAGLSWAGTGIAARVLVVPRPLWHLLTEPVAWAVVLYGLLGTLLFATALQRGSVTAVAALVFVVETVVAAIVGLTLLGDRSRPRLGGVALAGITVTVLATIVLARFAEVAPEEDTSSASGAR